MAGLAGSSRPVDAADAADLRKEKWEVETAQPSPACPRWCHRMRTYESEENMYQFVRISKQKDIIMLEKLMEV
jgi:hypothetical protein